MKTYISKILFICSIAVAFSLIISAYSFASGDRYGLARTVKSVFAAAFSPNQEEIEIYFRPNGNASSSSADVTPIDALLVINDLSRASERLCTVTSEVELRILPGLNIVNIKVIGDDLVIRGTSGDDDVSIQLSGECPKDRLFVEIGVRRFAANNKKFPKPIAFSILNKEGRTVAFSDLKPGSYTITEVVPTDNW